jgi:EAL domain-containing protein (putative c-di-GMP-specific phosphodiesterase class I)
MAALLVRSQEELLLDYVRRLAERASGRRAVHLRLSKLRAYNRRAHHLHAATSGFRGMVEAEEGQLFVLDSADAIFVYKADVHQRVEMEIQKICFLFSDDPALMDGRGAADFVSRFRVEEEDEYERFQSFVRDLVDRQAASSSAAACQLTTKERLKRKQTLGQPLTPELLAKLEGALSRADLSSLVRRQTVCALSPRLEIAPRFSELYVSIAELREILLPNVNLLGDRWLFQHLTETLDRRVLQLLTMPENAFAGDLSINLNVATLLSKGFGAFDNALSTHRAGSLIVELQAIDVFQDLRAFHLARKAVQDKGYRVCLDGVGYRDLELIDCRRLGVDLVKMLWDADLLTEGDPVLERLRSLVERLGPSRVVMCRVDARVAIDLGHALGISLFQGRCIEELLTNDNRRRHLLRLKQVLGGDK